MIFPELPKKSLFSNDTAAKFNCMNHVLRMVAATQKLCSSPMVIAFLSNTGMVTGSTKSFLVEEESSCVKKDFFPLSNSAQRKDFFSGDNEDLSSFTKKVPKIFKSLFLSVKHICEWRNQKRVK